MKKGGLDGILGLLLLKDDEGESKDENDADEAEEMRPVILSAGGSTKHSIHTPFSLSFTLI